MNFFFFFLSCFYFYQQIKCSRNLVIGSLLVLVDITSPLTGVAQVHTIYNQGNEPVQEVEFAVDKRLIPSITEIYFRAKNNEKLNIISKKMTDNAFIFVVALTILPHESVLCIAFYLLGKQYKLQLLSNNKNMIQHLTYEFPEHALTAYPVETHTFYIKINSNSYISSEGLVNVNSTHFILDHSIGSTRALAQAPRKVKIIVSHKDPIVQMNHFERTIKLSQLGMVEYIEHCEIHNVALSSHKEFHRPEIENAKYTTDGTFGLPIQNSNVIVLPKDVTYLEYYDDIGNISTSHVMKQKNIIYVTLFPRYELLPQWKADWYLRYLQKTSSVIRKIATNRYEAVLPIFPQYANIFIQNFTTRIVFPPGSYNIQITKIEENPSQTISMEKYSSWFDIFTQREALVIHSNATGTKINPNQLQIKVQYSVSLMYIFQFLQLAIIIYIMLLCSRLFQMLNGLLFSHKKRLSINEIYQELQNNNQKLIAFKKNEYSKQEEAKINLNRIMSELRHCQDLTLLIQKITKVLYHLERNYDMPKKLFTIKTAIYDYLDNNKYNQGEIINMVNKSIDNIVIEINKHFQIE